MAIESKVPGIIAYHVVITPNCRIVQGGNEEAFDEAVRRIRQQYDLCVHVNRNSDASFHLVLTLDRNATRTEEER